jgi:hypothetical protein
LEQTHEVAALLCSLFGSSPFVISSLLQQRHSFLHPNSIDFFPEAGNSDMNPRKACSLAQPVLGKPAHTAGK